MVAFVLLCGCSEPTDLASAARKQGVAEGEIAHVVRLAGHAPVFVGSVHEFFQRSGSAVAVEGGHVVRVRLADVVVPTLNLVLPHLVELELRRAKLTSLKGLAGAPQLEQLVVSENALTTLEGLAALPKLRVLSVSQNPLTALAGLPPGLTALEATDGAVISLEGLPAALSSLNLSRQKLVTLETLPVLPALRTLYLDGNPLTNVEGLERAPALEYVGLRQTAVTDVAALSRLPALRRVDLRETKVVSRPAVDAGVQFEHDGVWGVVDAGRVLTVWNGIPIPEPDQPFVQGLPARSGSLTSLSKSWNVDGVGGANVVTGRDGQPHGKVKLSVEKGRARAYLEYLAGYFVFCDAEPGKPCEVRGALIAGSRGSRSVSALKSSSMSGPTSWEVVLDSMGGRAEGVQVEFTAR
ncbi:MAG: leucine-rich repeat domain-containing protein [Archangium sp.]|nr:leucine-rich repeat domain-containing protein [Archangium sp.]